MVDLGARLRSIRDAAGLSLSAVASRTHYSKALLGHLETGRRTVRPDHVAAYARALDVPVDVFYDPTGDPLRVAHEWLVSDDPVIESGRTGRRVGERLATELEHRVVELRHLDDVIGGGDLVPLVRTELAAARRMTREASYSAATGRRLLRTVGELSQLAGWVAGDAGNHIEAQQTYLAGVSAARAADDRALTAQLLSSLAYQMSNVGDPVDAALLARSALIGARQASPMVRVLLWERVAWACARAQDLAGCRRALDAHTERSPGVAEPEWVYWLDRREIDIMAARCMIELGQPLRAEPLLVTALADYEPGHAREVGLYLTWLAESYVRSGVLDAARGTLDTAQHTATAVNSARLHHRIREVANLLDVHPHSR